MIPAVRVLRQALKSSLFRGKAGVHFRLKLLKNAVPLLFLLLSGPAFAQVLTLDEVLTGIVPQGAGPARLRWDPFFQGGVFSVSGHYIAFQTGNAGEEGLVLLDGRTVLPVPLPYLDKGLLCFPPGFAGAVRGALDALIQEDRSRFRIAAVIVDPGHGGRDSGAVGNHTIGARQVKAVEKDITLKVSKDLHTKLAAAYPDKQVLLTREGDSYPALEDRVAMAHAVSLKDNEAVLFISIHANASFNKNARGYEVWYLSPEYRRSVIDKDKYADSSEIVPILNTMLEEEFTAESIMMAKFILSRFDEFLGGRVPSRGIKAEEWFVVRNARMPSVLVELGFVTNEEDALLMTDETYLKNYSEALYKGLIDFITMFEQSGGFTAIQ
ncbi:MAG: N-acetylmuramoyl-L-alanine amidase [Treponema sp.]|jgi:N-acetylmuramoyl-L-alanine amidase|nr:N-acetylmuramoyl-L-alanine amidase [Treponema sp.]